MWNFQGSFFLALEFPRDLTQFCGISRDWTFCLEFLGIKKTHEKFLGDIQKVYPQPPLFGFFWNSPFQSCVATAFIRMNILICIFGMCTFLALSLPFPFLQFCYVRRFLVSHFIHIFSVPKIKVGLS